MGVGRGHGEVAQRSGRDALAQLDVDARGLQLAQVLVAVVDRLQLAALIALHRTGHVVVDQCLGVVGADQVVQLDAVVVHAQVGVGPRRQHHAEVHALGALGLQFVVADGEEGRVLARARHVRVTRIDHAAVGDAGAVGVFRQRRRTEALRGGGTHQQEVERLPAQADLRRERIAEIIVVIGARGSGQLQRRCQRHVHFGVGRTDLALAVHFGDGRAHLQAGVDLPRVVGIELLAAPLGTGSEADLAGPGVAQAAGDLGIDALQLGFGRTQRGDVDRVAHRLRRGRRVQQVVAARCQRIGQRPAVGEATGDALALAAARAERCDLPVPLRGGATQAEHAAVSGGAVGLEGAAKVEEGVFDRDRTSVRVVRVAGRQQRRHRFGQATVRVQCEAAALQSEERAAAKPRGALDLAVQHFAEGFDVVVQAEGAVGIGLVALGRRDQRGERRLVEAAGITGQAVDRRAGNTGGTGRAVAVGIEHRHRHAVDQVARALGRPAVPAAAGLVGVDAALCQVAFVLVQAFAVVALQAEEDVVAIGVQITQAADELQVLLVQAALVGAAEAAADLGAFEVLPGDDVDHTGHGVGAVDRRGAILEHFDAFDRDQRKRVEIDKGVGQATGREAVVGQATAIEQHQRVLLRQATQADAGRAGGPAVVGGFVAGVAGVRRDRAQHIGHGGLAGLFQLLAADHLHRVGGLGIGALDVGTGDAHGGQGAGFATGVGGGFGGGGQRRGQSDGQGRHEQGVLGHDDVGEVERAT
ncbi:hypothetical protein PGKDCPLP_02872 [Stenotrophomonas maltophilia]|nr:hypothetical protein PGKDCPLP_02872 [Stenotrophomonas maltophilia]